MKPSFLENTERYLVWLITSPRQPRSVNRPTKVFLGFLRHLAGLYRGVIQTRLWLYTHGIFRPHALGCQVISVGNVTVGGTGKTPVVEVFARELAKQGRKVAILSRGYKKKEANALTRILERITLAEQIRPPRVVSDGTQLLLDSDMSGDEPYMLASNLPSVAVLVDRDRIKSGRYAINKLGCDTLILDDGFQYLSLKHRMEIVLIDSTNPFGNEYMLPRGVLREPISNIKRATFIFLTKADSGNTAALKKRIRHYNKTAEIIECKHSARHLQHIFTAERKPLEFLKRLKAVTVAGIAVPQGFEHTIEKFGVDIRERHRFADHHRYTQQEVIDIINEAKRIKADAIITTEKDAVRFPRLDRCDVPIYFLRVDIEILSGREDFHACISRICFTHENGRQPAPAAQDI